MLYNTIKYNYTYEASKNMYLILKKKIHKPLSIYILLKNLLYFLLFFSFYFL